MSSRFRFWNVTKGAKQYQYSFLCYDFFRPKIILTNSIHDDEFLYCHILTTLYPFASNQVAIALILAEVSAESLGYGRIAYCATSLSLSPPY